MPEHDDTETRWKLWTDRQRDEVQAIRYLADLVSSEPERTESLVQAESLLEALLKNPRVARERSFSRDVVDLRERLGIALARERRLRSAPGPVGWGLRPDETPDDASPEVVGLMYEILRRGHAAARAQEQYEHYLVTWEKSFDPKQPKGTQTWLYTLGAPEGPRTPASIPDAPGPSSVPEGVPEGEGTPYGDLSVEEAARLFRIRQRRWDDRIRTHLARLRGLSGVSPSRPSRPPTRDEPVDEQVEQSQE